MCLFTFSSLLSSGRLETEAIVRLVGVIHGNFDLYPTLTVATAEEFRTVILEDVAMNVFIGEPFGIPLSPLRHSPFGFFCERRAPFHTYTQTLAISTLVNVHPTILSAC